MWQTLLTTAVLCIALFFIGKRIYKQMRRAIDPSQNISCGCSCSGCGESKCTANSKNHTDRNTKQS